MEKHSSYREPIGPSGKPRPIPARTVTISPEAVAATDAAIGKLWSKGIRFNAVGRARIESAIEASIREAKEDKP